MAHPNGLPQQNQQQPNLNQQDAYVSSSLDRDNFDSNFTNTYNTPFIAPGVKDAWLALLINSTMEDNQNAIFNSSHSNTEEGGGQSSPAGAVENSIEYPLPKGQLSKATKIHALETSLKRAAHVASQLNSYTDIKKKMKTPENRKDDNHSNNNTKEEEEEQEENIVQSHVQLMKGIHDEIQMNQQNQLSSTSQMTPDWFMYAFQTRIREIRDYHARHDAAGGAGAIGGNPQQDVFMDYSLDQMVMMNDHQDRRTNMDDTNINTNNNPMQSIIDKQRKKRRIANPPADGYDLYSILNVNLQKIKNGDLFTMEEVLGKYLDLISIHEGIISSEPLNDMFLRAVKQSSSSTSSANTITTTNINTTTSNQENDGNGDKEQDDIHETSTVKHHENISYPDFCILLQKGLATSIAERDKLSSTNGARKKYIRFLSLLQSYLISYLSKVSPLLDIEKDVIQPSMDQFDLEWSKYGGVSGWERKASERVMIVSQGKEKRSTGVNGEQQKPRMHGIDLQKFNDVEMLFNSISADELKAELARLGLKCGGAPLDRAKRLWLTKDTPLCDLPDKLFAKNGKKLQNNSNNVSKDAVVSDAVVDSEGSFVSAANQRRVDIARLEVVVTSLLDQLRPTLDATARRAERRLTQTLNEKEREMEEEINGAFNNEDGEDGTNAKKNRDEGESDSEDEDAPIYNPKGVPLGWDGKPIPYWLFKLHGLNHFYPCEICGNESYRGSHNFEKHFAEAKHSYGMRCLGIPNTRHFHGVTKIEDAQRLWDKLQSEVNKDIFDGAKEEEYEDSHGNVLSRATYEDLARQGLL